MRSSGKIFAVLQVLIYVLILKSFGTPTPVLCVVYCIIFLCSFQIWFYPLCCSALALFFSFKALKLNECIEIDPKKICDLGISLAYFFLMML